jgi:hypothetical protein
MFHLIFRIGNLILDPGQFVSYLLSMLQGRLGRNLGYYVKDDEASTGSSGGTVKKLSVE